MTPVRLELAALRSRVKHSNTESLGSQYGNVVNMAVAGKRAKLCHFASYIMYFQKVIVYNIPAVGEEDLLAYCDLM